MLSVGTGRTVTSSEIEAMGPIQVKGRPLVPAHGEWNKRAGNRCRKAKKGPSNEGAVIPAAVSRFENQVHHTELDAALALAEIRSLLQQSSSSMSALETTSQSAKVPIAHGEEKEVISPSGGTVFKTHAEEDEIMEQVEEAHEEVQKGVKTFYWSLRKRRSTPVSPQRDEKNSAIAYGNDPARVECKDSRVRLPEKRKKPSLRSLRNTDEDEVLCGKGATIRSAKKQVGRPKGITLLPGHGNGKLSKGRGQSSGRPRGRPRLLKKPTVVPPVSALLLTPEVVADLQKPRKRGRPPKLEVALRHAMEKKARFDQAELLRVSQENARLLVEEKDAMLIQVSEVGSSSPNSVRDVAAEAVVLPTSKTDQIDLPSLSEKAMMTNENMLSSHSTQTEKQMKKVGDQLCATKGEVKVDTIVMMMKPAELSLSTAEAPIVTASLAAEGAGIHSSDEEVHFLKGDAIEDKKAGLFFDGIDHDKGGISMRDEAVQTSVKLEPQGNVSAEEGEELLPASAGGSKRSSLSEAEREARKLRRVQANRESARQTIRRKQVMCEHLSKKVAELQQDNETFKKEVEVAKRKWHALMEYQLQLKAELAQCSGAGALKSDSPQVGLSGRPSQVTSPSGLQLQYPPPVFWTYAGHTGSKSVPSWCNAPPNPHFASSNGPTAIDNAEWHDQIRLPPGPSAGAHPPDAKAPVCFSLPQASSRQEDASTCRQSMVPTLKAVSSAVSNCSAAPSSVAVQVGPSSDVTAASLVFASRHPGMEGAPATKPVSSSGTSMNGPSLSQSGSKGLSSLTELGGTSGDSNPSPSVETAPAQGLLQACSSVNSVVLLPSPEVAFDRSTAGNRTESQPVVDRDAQVKGLWHPAEKAASGQGSIPNAIPSRGHTRHFVVQQTPLGFALRSGAGSDSSTKATAVMLPWQLCHHVCQSSTPSVSPCQKKRVQDESVGRAQIASGGKLGGGQQMQSGDIPAGGETRPLVLARPVWGQVSGGRSVAALQAAAEARKRRREVTRSRILRRGPASSRLPSHLAEGPFAQLSSA